jgi:glyoxylase-like metal-dependent hydrolase (beta-lactamase superfamily II)
MKPVVILEGMLVRDLAGNILDASSTVTLIDTADRGFILIDTGEPGRRGELISALEKNNVKAGDIHYLVNTHSHHDHKGNNSLFANAVQLIHPADSYRNEAEGKKLKFVEEGFELSARPRSYVMETPGHTRGSITIIVECPEVYAVTGDALPLEDNYKQWVPPGINIDPALALKSMERIVKTARCIIPGHDKMFEID